MVRNQQDRKSTRLNSSHLPYTTLFRSGCTASGACEPGLRCLSGKCASDSSGAGQGESLASAGHRWCVDEAKGGRIPFPGNGYFMWAASTTDAWFVTNKIGRAHV